MNWYDKASSQGLALWKHWIVMLPLVARNGDVYVIKQTRHYEATCCRDNPVTPSISVVAHFVSHYRFLSTGEIVLDCHNSLREFCNDNFFGAKNCTLRLCLGQ